MRASRFMGVLALAALVLCGTGAGTGGLARAQTVTAAPAADQAAATEARQERERADVVRAKAQLAESLRQKADAIAALKRQRESWNRDRKIRKLLAESRELAKALAANDQALLEVDAWLARARRALLAAIDAELGAEPAPSAVRRGRLEAARAEILRQLAPSSRKIVLPDDSIDPLADAEELAAQIALIETTERELLREEEALARRIARYQKMARLRRERARADEVDLFGDDRPRRTTGRQTSGAAAPDRDDGKGAPAPQTGDDTADAEPGELGSTAEPPVGDSGDPIVVLADVVDADTLAALRRAERSDDPLVKAQAAERVSQQVRERRERLQKRQQLIEKRMRELRGAR
jgi:hypothetical protein